MDAAKTMSSLRSVDELHLQHTALSRRHPVTHVAVTLAFIVIVLSVGKYEAAGLISFVFYPIVTLIFGNIPFGIIARRLIYVLPLIVVIGIFNPVFDKNLIVVGSMYISAGWLSLAAIIIKCMLTVSAALLLIAVTGIEGIARALRFLKTPAIITALITFTYRYIHVLGEEAVHIFTAYKLRAPQQKGVAIKYFGSLCGNLFLRSMKKADDIYNAMICRGFNGDFPIMKKQAFKFADALYICLWLAFFILARMIDIPLMLGNFVIGLGI